MEEVLRLIADYVSLALGAIAILVIVIGAAEAVIGIFGVMLKKHAPNAEKRAVWLDFARWLIAHSPPLLPPGSAPAPRSRGRCARRTAPNTVCSGRGRSATRFYHIVSIACGRLVEPFGSQHPAADAGCST